MGPNTQGDAVSYSAGQIVRLYFLAAASRSAIQTLIKDWRGTPRRFASKSNREIIHDGKSTLTRLA
jgi:hypothetical protein